MSEPIVITGSSSLRALIDREKAAQKLSDAEICRRAGMNTNIMGNLRAYPRRRTQSATMIALVNALGYKLVAVPEEQQ